MTVSIGDPAGLKCPQSAITYQVGNPKAPSITVTPNDPGDRLIDGEHNAKIKCSVTGSGPFKFSATIQGLSTLSARVTLTMDGTINADKLTGNATVGVNSPGLSGNTYTSMSNACTVTVVGSNVKPGSLWAAVKCDNLTLASAPGQACAVQDTTNFVIENCEGS